jgi:hypothetical protein
MGEEYTLFTLKGNDVVRGISDPPSVRLAM